VTRMVCQPVAPSGSGEACSPVWTAPGPSVDAWRQWVYEWDATPGRHLIAVRATDGPGAVQTGEQASPDPDGATGWHTIRVTVT
jgi:hypothetical protein